MSSQNSRMSQAKRSSTQKSASSNSNSYEKHSSHSKSRGSSASNLHFTSYRRDSSKPSVSTSTINAEPIYVNGNIEPFTSTSTTHREASYHQQYSTEVLSGCNSLGVDVPKSMHAALVDQHGYSTLREISHSTTVVNFQYSPDSQYLVTNSDTAGWSYDNSSLGYWHTWKTDDLYGTLAGIGAQFEAPRVD